MSLRQIRALIVAWLGLLWLFAPSISTAQSVNVFQGLTKHIHRQIQQDKRAFHDAEFCTEWFYRQEKKPSFPKAEGIGWSGQTISARPAINASDCPTRYPKGLEAARQDFSATQSALSLSLTFYQFALVGDRNDDDRYNAAELQDMLEAFKLSYDQTRPAAAHLAALKSAFDTVHKSGGMEQLMTGMGALFDKGYRLTERDRSAIEHITK